MGISLALKEKPRNSGILFGQIFDYLKMKNLKRINKFMETKFVNKILLVVIILIVVVGAVFIYKQINGSFFTFNKDKCIENFVEEMASRIDTNAYLIDVSDDNLRFIAKVYGISSDEFLSNKTANRDVINKINNTDILYLSKHPEWREANQFKIKGILEKNNTIKSEIAISSFVKNLKSINICSRPNFLKEKRIEITENPAYFYSKDFDPNKIVLYGAGIGDEVSKIKINSADITLASITCEHYNLCLSEELNISGWIYMESNGYRRGSYRIANNKIVGLNLNGSTIGIFKEDEIIIKFGKPDKQEKDESVFGGTKYFYIDRGLIVKASSLGAINIDVIGR
ncbi:MAG: hypothetical protein ABH830_04155 [Patescibacteria group bacterium]